MQHIAHQRVFSSIFCTSEHHTKLVTSMVPPHHPVLANLFVLCSKAVISAGLVRERCLAIELGLFKGSTAREGRLILAFVSPGVPFSPTFDNCVDEGKYTFASLLAGIGCHVNCSRLTSGTGSAPPRSKLVSESGSTSDTPARDRLPAFERRRCAEPARASDVSIFQSPIATRINKWICSSAAFSSKVQTQTVIVDATCSRVRQIYTISPHPASPSM